MCSESDHGDTGGPKTIPSPRRKGESSGDVSADGAAVLGLIRSGQVGQARQGVKLGAQ